MRERWLWVWIWRRQCICGRRVMRGIWRRRVCLCDERRQYWWCERQCVCRICCRWRIWRQWRCWCIGWCGCRRKWRWPIAEQWIVYGRVSRLCELGWRCFGIRRRWRLRECVCWQQWIAISEWRLWLIWQ